MPRVRPIQRAAALLLLMASARLAAAQEGEVRGSVGAITGEVIDAESERPLPKSTVVLRLVEEGAIVSAGTTPPTTIALARSVVTDDSGRYRFAGLATGRYQLHVQRLGYQPANVEVEMRDDAARVSVGMVVVPVRLSPLPVNADRVPSFETQRATRGDSVESNARVLAARARQARYASTDVREITDADLIETGALDETDLFRALQRLPGITTRDDATAELWTRGTPWDETRVYFDGVPLFMPIHNTFTSGTITGLGTDVIGSAVIFPGVRPASIGEGVTALDLRTRPPTFDDELRGVAELTALSGRLALSRGGRRGNGWSIAGRHETQDLVQATGSKLGASDWSYRAHRTYYDDVTARLDRSVTPSTRIAVSALYSADHVRDRTVWPDTEVGRSLRRSVAARLTLTHEGRDLQLRQTWAISDYHDAPHPSSPESYFVVPTGLGFDTLRAALQYASVSGEVLPVVGSDGRWWRTGYDLTLQRLATSGTVASQPNGAWVTSSLARASSLPQLDVWGEERWKPRSWLRVDAGVRVDVGRYGDSPAARAMPRLEARAALDDQTTLSLGIGRSYQYTQSVQLEAGGGVSVYDPLWRMADGTTPALRADMVTVGAERWLDDAWLVGANVYGRATSGQLLRDPGVSQLAPTAATVVGSGRGAGIELSARRLAGRVTGSVGYTLAISRSSAEGMTFPAAEDRRQSVDASMLWQLSRRTRLGAGFTWMSGYPATPSTVYSTDSSFASGSIVDIRAGAPNSVRGPAQARTDLLADWSGLLWRGRFGAFVGARTNWLPFWNPRRNPASYAGADCPARVPGEVCRSFGAPIPYGVPALGSELGIRFRF